MNDITEKPLKIISKEISNTSTNILKNDETKPDIKYQTKCIQNQTEIYSDIAQQLE